MKRHICAVPVPNPVSDRILDELFEQLTALEGVARDSSVRAEKLACEGLLKHPEAVTFRITEEGGVVVSCERGEKMFWSVDYHPDGRFSLHMDMNGSSDTRIRKVLKALGETKRK